MGILKIEKELNEAKNGEYKYEYHDLCVKLVPQLIEKIKEFEGIDEKSIESMRNQIHDRLYDVFGEVPTEDTIEHVCSEIPEHIKKEAELWGWDDTVVGDNLYVWIEKTYGER